MIPAKIFLAAVGTIYLALAIWCTIDPQTTSAKVGFQLSPGSGESEFVTVYGGLELALGLILMMPLVWADSTRFALTACLTVHLSLVLFRSMSYLRFEGIDAFTHRLAICEWVILLASVAVLLTIKPPPKT